jgi:hypothetical protein
MGSLTILLICLATLAFAAFRHKIGVPSNYSIPPFQAGVLFRRGHPVRELGPGRHRVFLGKEKIILIDKRPIQVSVEQRAVALADGATAVYGFSASARVSDAQKAIYSCSEYSKVPAFVTLCVARSAINLCQPSQIKLEQAELTEQITAECRTRLTAAGFELLSFGFSQLAVVTPGPIPSPRMEPPLNVN